MSHPWDDFRAGKHSTGKVEEPKPEKKAVAYSVKNYYALTEAEIDESIQAMREWMRQFPTSDKMGKVMFALDVALNAKEVVRDIEKDEFLKLVVDTLC